MGYNDVLVLMNIWSQKQLTLPRQWRTYRRRYAILNWMMHSACHIYACTFPHYCFLHQDEATVMSRVMRQCLVLIMNV